MSLQQFKCPNCNGAITFDPTAQSLVCPYCNAEIDVQSLAASEADLSKDQASEAIDWGFQGNEWGAGEQDGLVVYTCQSCAGEIVGDQTLGATTCPFCGNPVVMTSKFSGSLKPDSVLPFKITKDMATAALKTHYQKKKLLPKVFKDENHLDEIKGVYVPFWLFDADADARITYDATRTRAWSDRNYNYIETSHYEVLREGGIGFNYLPVDGSKAVEDVLMESIEPFAYNEAVAFSTPYLAGYFANKYDVTAEDSMGRANERFKNSTAAEFLQTVVGYDTVIPKYTNIKLKKGKIRYALMPVWFLATSWKGENFLFAMNGQTGKFIGNLPMDKKAFGRWFLLLTVIPFVILLILLLLGFGAI